MKRIILLFCLINLFCTSSLRAQCTVSILADTVACVGEEVTINISATGPLNTLLASNAAGNNHRGSMFNIIATNAVEILSFEVSPLGNTTMEVYYKVGTWEGSATNPNDWTLIGSAPVTYTGNITPLDLPINIIIPAGETYGFYVTSSNIAYSLNYSNGTAVGNIHAYDANISFTEGAGMEYPFTAGTGTLFQPRVWNGRINYSLANLPTTYSWSTSETTPSINAVINSPTTFSVLANVQGCPTATDAINIQTSTPIVDAGSDKTICFGDSLTLQGSGAMTYTWNNGIEDSVAFLPNSAGELIYTVIGTDLYGCTGIDTTVVTVNEVPILQHEGDQIICLGNEAILTASGADTSIWNNSVVNGVPFTPTSSDYYVVTGHYTATGCTSTDSVYIEVRTPTPAVVNQIDHQLISNQASAYQWIDCSTNTPIPDANLQLFTATENGSYALIMENEVGCVDTSACFTINTVGIDKINKQNWSIQPNPSTGIFTLEGNSALNNQLIEVYSTVGQLIFQETINGSKLKIDLSNEPNGVYILKLNKDQHYKILKQ